MALDASGYDCDFRSTPEFRKKIESVTGYWSSLLYQLHPELKQYGSGGSQIPAEALVRAGATTLMSNIDLFGLADVQAGVVLKQFAALDLPCGNRGPR